MSATTYIELTTEQGQAFRPWLLANDYAEFPDRFGYNNGCAEHPRQGKIYHYTRGGYYRCYQCVKAEFLAATSNRNDEGERE